MQIADRIAGADARAVGKDEIGGGTRRGDADDTSPVRAELRNFLPTPQGRIHTADYSTEPIVGRRLGGAGHRSQAGAIGNVATDPHQMRPTSHRVVQIAVVISKTVE